MTDKKQKAFNDMLQEYKDSYVERLETFPAKNIPEYFTPDNPFSDSSDYPVSAMKVHAISSFSKEDMYQRLAKQDKLHKMIGKNVVDLDDDDLTDDMFNEYFDMDNLPNVSLVKNPSTTPPAHESGAEGSSQDSENED